jgi:hypothetical protein
LKFHDSYEMKESFPVFRYLNLEALWNCQMDIFTGLLNLEKNRKHFKGEITRQTKNWEANVETR